MWSRGSRQIRGHSRRNTQMNYLQYIHMKEAKVPKSPTSMVAIMKIINSRHHINNDRHYHHHNEKCHRKCQTDMHSQHCPSS
eukprot:06850_4